ncbi:hypothetical protein BDZ85DRAFT_271280 [Elsinoe ampelina]|uniref:Mad3/BUB1 homology region 1-domain-containing protein n=1 Tax=Elsinoe ampelina TaxID=302913 RepID=A0A6A6GPR4_9PEZI|nr:hypothetical protein BDZ85DRAFT_271280 [Elsinoe ampelina]
MLDRLPALRLRHTIENSFYSRDGLSDFTLLESHKENITSLPSGRSAKALAAIYSPPLTARPSEHNDAHSAQRNAFEAEVVLLDEADDPLDVWERYVRWIEGAYADPAAPAAGLCGVLERGTKSLLKRAEYKNDVRYLKLWLRYVRLFAESPREVFVYLARNGVGEGLALYYEEFAGWLEGEGRWSQAHEVYTLGMEKGARPVERLGRRFAEFEARRGAKGEEGARPDSPALPVVRAVLGERVDPFAAGQRAQAGADKAEGKKKKAKMAIFADGEAKESVLGSGDGNWDFGTTAGRKVENDKEAGKWEGQTLKVGKTNGGMEKMKIFKVSAASVSPDGRDTEGTRTNRRSVEQGETSSQPSESKSNHEAQCTINPRTGKREVVHVNLDVVYTDIGRTKIEFSFEEVMAKHRGWLERDWKVENRARDEETRRMKFASPDKKPKKKGGFEIFHDSATPEAMVSPVVVVPQPIQAESLPARTVVLNDENNENAIRRPAKDKNDVAKRMRKEEKANRTRKIKVMEVRHEKKETQTVQLNFASPTGPKLRRKRTADPTVTINTKEAMDEIYGIFDQPAEGDSSSSEEEADDSDDDYTSGAESTTTGRISAPTSEYGEETRNEILQAHQAMGTLEDGEDSEGEAATTDAEERTEHTGWSDFTTSKHMPREDDSPPHKSKLQIFQDDAESHQAATHVEDDHLTPCEDDPSSPRTMYIPIPPEDFEASNATYRSRAIMANNRLPFMTPIAEQTESSIGTSKTEKEKDYFTSKTPSRQTQPVQPILEDSDETWSSPFQDQMSDSSNDKQFLIKQKKVVSLQALTPITSSLDVTGPIIPDKQVNPCDPAIRDIILAQMRPALSTYPGFFDHRSEGENTRLAEIKKYAKAVGSKKGNNGDKTGSTLSFPPTITFSGTDNTYTVKRELGCGAFGPVYLVERHSSDQSPTSRGTLEAMKLELSPPSAWEFHMLHLSHLRLSSSPRLLPSLIPAHELHLHPNASFLLESYSPTGTLLDLVNLARSLEGCNGGQSAGLEESLAMFYTVELLRFVEGMHSHSLIHGDLKADNVMLRLPSAPGPQASWSPTYAPDGGQGWADHGVTLIDFGRGIDMRNFRPDVKFVADWATTDADCVEMRELRGWTFQIDYHGLAGTAHTLLFGRYMSVVPDRAGGGGIPRSEAGRGRRRSGGGAGEGSGQGEADLIDLSSPAGEDALLRVGREERPLAEQRRWKTRESLKRYWATDIWGEFFGLMLNSAGEEAGRGEDAGRMPLVNGMRRVRERMERYLVGVQGLRERVARVEQAARERARK